MKRSNLAVFLDHLLAIAIGVTLAYLLFINL
ncbi:hypothetical protein UFOVP815_10 [uncultured Caudovirales phage]|uniref:Uncharacterized protein n=1 Tax=uncultured Caudovirales phage TaxID=2100421 RepID=A0A6J5P187_9CAUD|nr:hypothetical protein UFOVP815_10 [uncultured Caudovirales phage]